MACDWLAAVTLSLAPVTVLLLLLLVSGARWAPLTGAFLGARRRRGTACVRRTHAYVFSNCTHGQALSVLETFDLYARSNPSLSLGRDTGECLDEVMRRVSPHKVLELGMHCGYSSIRMLRLLPPGGRLVTVEVDPQAAEKGEELILVAGFKYSQFQVLACSSAEAIPALRPHLGGEEEKEEGASVRGLELVLMDHEVEQYLPDLLALEREGLFSPAGCCLLLVSRGRQRSSGALLGLLEHLAARPETYSVRDGTHEDMLEVQYHPDSGSI